MTLAMVAFTLATMVASPEVRDRDGSLVTLSFAAVPAAPAAVLGDPRLAFGRLAMGPVFQLSMPGTQPASPSPSPAFAIATFGVDARLDPRHRRGRVSLGGDDSGNLLLHFDWRTGLGAFGAYDVRIQPSINLSLFGRWYRLATPDIRVRPGANGAMDVQLDLSLFERRF